MIISVQECSLPEAIRQCFEDLAMRRRLAEATNNLFCAFSGPLPKKKWERMMTPACTCGANLQIGALRPYVHGNSCPLVGLYPVPVADDAKPQLLMPQKYKLGAKKHRHKRKPTRVPDYKFTLHFQFTRPINLALWKKIKAPVGWKKNPVTAEKQRNYRGVRFRCTDLKYALTPEQISLLHMQLIMCLEGAF